MSPPEWPSPVSEGQALALAPERILHLLSEGQIEIEGLIPWSSNATLLVTIHDDEFSTLGVYKPQRGERPLWDFAYGTLGMREVAAYLVSEALGWAFVPPTVLRQGPRGMGSIQLFIHAPDDAHFIAVQADASYRADLQRLAAFDVVVSEEGIYQRLNRLAAQRGDTAGLRVRTAFKGVRGEPETDAGSIEGISVEGMDLGALARATLQGIVDELYLLYTGHGGLDQSQRQVVAAGGAVERNPILLELIQGRFGLPVQAPPFEEPAAVGSAMLAAHHWPGPA